jgi:hypothetical protein
MFQALEQGHAGVSAAILINCHDVRHGCAPRAGFRLPRTAILEPRHQQNLTIAKVFRNGINLAEKLF